MNKNRILVVFVLLLLLLAGSPLFSANLTAEYSEEMDTTIASSSSFGVQAPNYSLAFHVGTLTIQKIPGGGLFSGTNFQDLLLTHSGSRNNPLTLVSNRPIGGKTTFNAQLVAKVQHNSSTQVVVLDPNKNSQILINSDLKSYPITIDYYVRIAGIPAVELVAGAHFQFANPPGGTLGNFTLQATYYVWFFPGTENIKIGGSSSAAPFFMTDYSSGSPNFINIDSINPPVTASLSITQQAEEKIISLSQAFNNTKVKVGEARITVQGFDYMHNYGVNVVFSDYIVPSSNSFMFRLTGAGGGTTIPFTLLLGTNPSQIQIIQPKVPFTWDNLSCTAANIKNLYVTGISPNTAQSSLSGAYTTTIKVEITPLDSNIQVE